MLFWKKQLKGLKHIEELDNSFHTLYEIKDAQHEYEEATKVIEEIFVETVNMLFDIIEASKAFNVNLPFGYVVSNTVEGTDEPCIRLKHYDNHGYYGGWNTIYTRDNPVKLNDAIIKFLNDVNKGLIQKTCKQLLERVEERKQLAEKQTKILDSLGGLKKITNEFKESCI